MLNFFKKNFIKNETKTAADTEVTETNIEVVRSVVYKEKYDELRRELGCPKCGRGGNGFPKEGTDRYNRWFNSQSEDNKNKIILAKATYESALATEKDKKLNDRLEKRSEAKAKLEKKKDNKIQDSGDEIKSETMIMLELWYKKRNELSSKVQANSPYDTLHYSICNSRQISLGTRSEAAIDEMVKKAIGFELLPKEVWYMKKGETEMPKHPRKVDHVWKSPNGIIYAVEQKLKDNHDNTKEDGQVDDFNAKVKAIRERYQNETVKGIFWFIEDSEKPSERVLKDKLEHDCEVKYGGDIFDGIEGGYTVWNEFSNWLDKNRHERLNIEFDKNPEFYFNDLVSHIGKGGKNFLKRFMGDENVSKFILPEISPEGKFADMVKKYLGMVD